MAPGPLALIYTYYLGDVDRHIASKTLYSVVLFTESRLLPRVGCQRSPLVLPPAQQLRLKRRRPPQVGQQLRPLRQVRHVVAARPPVVLQRPAIRARGCTRLSVWRCIALYSVYWRVLACMAAQGARGMQCPSTQASLAAAFSIGLVTHLPSASHQVGHFAI